jgi:hypothetical protein
MVGLNNGSYEQPWLRAIHGPSELVREREEEEERGERKRGEREP